jgi:hypothetical protein
MSNPVTRTRQGLTRRVVLTNAQIKALPATFIPVVLAAGVGRVLVAIQATFQLIWVADYTNIDANCALIVGIPGVVDMLVPALENPNGVVSLLLANGAPSMGFTGIKSPIDATPNLVMQAGAAPASCENVPLQLIMSNGASGNLTGGDPGNSLIVNIFYNVVKLF